MVLPIMKFFSWLFHRDSKKDRIDTLRPNLGGKLNSRNASPAILTNGERSKKYKKELRKSKSMANLKRTFSTLKRSSSTRRLSPQSRQQFDDALETYQEAQPQTATFNPFVGDTHELFIYSPANSTYNGTICRHCTESELTIFDKENACSPLYLLSESQTPNYQINENSSMDPFRPQLPSPLHKRFITGLTIKTPVPINERQQFEEMQSETSSSSDGTGESDSHYLVYSDSCKHNIFTPKFKPTIRCPSIPADSPQLEPSTSLLNTYNNLRNTKSNSGTDSGDKSLFSAVNKAELWDYSKITLVSYNNS